ncbi:MAG: hypothetical protein ACTJHT_15430 [Sphingobacterium sp.]
MSDIYFSEQDKVTFLSKRGWSINLKEGTSSWPIHGSRFEDHYESIWVAEKNGEMLPLEQAFRRELKTKILNE